MRDYLEEFEDALAFLRGNVLILVTTRALRMFAVFLVLPFYPFYVLALGGSYFSIGIISAVAGVFSVVPILIGGHLADMRSRKNLVSFLTIALGPLRLINAWAPHWLYLLIGSSMSSMLYGLRSPALFSIMADSLKPENRGKGYGVWSGLPMVLAVIAPALASWMVLRIDIVKTLRLGYLIGAIAITIGGVIQFFFLRDTFEPNDETMTLKESFTSLTQITKEMPKSLKTLLLVNTLAALGWGLKKRYRATYAVEVIGLTAPQWGVLYSLTRGLRIVLVPLFGHVVDRIGRKKSLLIGLACIPIMNLVFIYSTNLVFASLSYMSYYFARHLRRIGIRSTKADLSPKEKRGKINSLFRIFNRPLNRGGVLLGGILYGSVTKSSPFFIEAFIFVGLLLVSFLFVENPKKVERMT